MVLHVERGIAESDKVIVSRYELRGVRHFKIRHEDSEIHPAYDAQHLPRFLFAGAGLMTLATLSILWWRLPDLPIRAARVLRGLYRKRAIVRGIDRIPNDGPTVLVTTSADPEALASILSATDRWARFFSDPAKLNVAMKMLQRGHIIGVVLNGEKGAELLKAVAGRIPVEFVPVFVGVEEKELIVAFGKSLPGAMGIDELRAKIELARFDEAQ